MSIEEIEKRLQNTDDCEGCPALIDIPRLLAVAKAAKKACSLCMQKMKIQGNPQIEFHCGTCSLGQALAELEAKNGRD